MPVNLIINLIVLYFVGLLLVSVVAFKKEFFKKAAGFFVVINCLGFLAGAMYLLNFSGQELVIAQFNWLFHFTPKLTLLSGIFLTSISGVSALVGLYSIRYLILYEKTYHPGLVLALMSAFVLGMQGVLLANNSFAFLFFWEIMSVTSFFLVLIDKSQESLKAAFLYFVMTHLGASAIMAGFLILSKGSLLFDLQNVALASQGLSPAMLILVFLLFLFGFGSKAGLVPFHVWLPEAHPQAPSNISAMMSGLMLKVAVYGFITVVFQLVRLPEWAGVLVIILGLLSGVVGVLYALIEKDIKRVFAYSSIENMGIIFTMLGLALYLMTKTSIVGMNLIVSAILAYAIFHALSHVLFKTALFLSSGVIINRVHSRSLEVMGGIAKLMPYFSFAFLIVILGSLPIAPFSTFYGEWGFIQSIVGLFSKSFLGANALMLLVLVLTIVCLISGLAIFAMIRVFAISMLGLSRSKHLETTPEKTDWLLILPIFILAFLILVLGIFAQPVLSWLIQYASLLTGASNVSSISLSTVPLSSALFFILSVLAILLAVFFKRLVAKTKLERAYHTWDCGQPINAGMEYTATAFSAPIRFFFMRFLGSTKMVTATPIIESNPWLKKYTFSLVITSAWKDKLYQPVAKFLISIAGRVKAIQSGRIQYYLLFLLATLIITLIIAL